MVWSIFVGIYIYITIKNHAINFKSNKMFILESVTVSSPFRNPFPVVIDLQIPC